MNANELSFLLVLCYVFSVVLSCTPAWRLTLAREAISQEISSKEIGKGQGNTTEFNSVTVKSLPTNFLPNMETIQKYSGLGGGITRTTFK